MLLLLSVRCLDQFVAVKGQQSSEAKFSLSQRNKPKSVVATNQNGDNSNRAAAKRILAEEEARTGWKVFTGDDVFLVWYNTRSVVDLTNGKVRVWIKRSLHGDYKDKPLEAREKLKLKTEGYDNYSYTVELHEYNCRLREFRILSDTDYDRAGKVIDSVELTDAAWSYVVPNSISEILLNTVCRLKR